MTGVPSPHRPARVVLAPDSFKGSATAAEVVAALGAGWRSERPRDQVVGVPIADGGEGTLDVFAVGVPGSERHPARVTGPDGRGHDAEWLSLPDGTAVIELARASGLPLMRELDPLGAQTVGLGELVAAAIDAGVDRVLITLGGSASTDGGTGALAALGARFLDAAGRPLAVGGGALTSLAHIDLTGLRPAPAGGAYCLVDVDAPLLGPAGAAAVFGPQKGAGPADITRLEEGLRRLAHLLGGAPDAAGAGAAGGTAYGLAAAWGAEVVPGLPTIIQAAGLPAALAGADWVVTGEGRFDRTSLSGKVVGGVLALARDAEVPVLLVAGRVDAPRAEGVRAEIALVDLAGGPAMAMAEPLRWLRRAGAELARRVTTAR
ncbi:MULTISPECIES: glycerate kinase [Frankia]|uniref:glycerate kinase n=1 Tax=Frankia TaxID=1854 RepID=UPI000461439A|nr:MULTISPECIES: glycerate kinase [Frankia]KDA44182.1 glycerate kinase [Frankia sp. BMG5.23]KEZ37805.1 glycerate kinase [Frankia sp. CeD]ORT96257.1 glycerate kinase [Frankia casuarinae]